MYRFQSIYHKSKHEEIWRQSTHDIIPFFFLKPTGITDKSAFLLKKIKCIFKEIGGIPACPNNTITTHHCQSHHSVRKAGG